MKIRYSLAAACFVLTATLSLNAQVSGRFSAAPMNPDAVAKMKAKGKPVPAPFPNWVNRGKKFNPQGEVIQPLVTAGEQRVLAIFVEFTTPPPGGPAERLDLAKYFDTMLFGDVYDPPEYAPYDPHPTDRTLKNYYKVNTYGKVDVVTLNMPSSLGWADAGHSYDYYCKGDGVHDNGFGPFPENAPGLVVAAINAVDPVVDFSKYAVDGEVPNIFVVHAGSGAEWSGDTNLIWSHSSSLGWFYPGGYEVDGVRVNNYAMMPEVGGDTTGFLGRVRGPYPPTVGVYAHEYGHVLGLPDQYDYGYESNGTEMFSLMAGGSWNVYPLYSIFLGNSPSSLDAWSKYRLGVVEPITVESLTEVTMRPAELHPDIYRMVVPFSGGLETYLFENRQAIGFDEGMYGAHGLAIYHIDDTVLNRNYWRPNEAENWKKFRSEGWKSAWTGESHYGISILQADGRWDLERGGYGDTGDLYPGDWGVTEFSSATNPNTSTYYFWPGAAPPFGWSHVKVSDIKETSEGNITATMGFEP